MRLNFAVNGSSRCGDDFDDYVRRVVPERFPYSHTDPISRTLEFWKYRSLKIYTEAGDVRQGRIMEWLQYNLGPYSMTTQWDVSVVFETEGALKKGDAVEIDGSPKAHHGKKGTVVKRLLSGEKYKICLDEDKLKFVTVHKDNLVHKTLFSVHRMNIEGGGTLKSPNNGETLLSLEWVDPPQPMIDLHPDYLGVNCPICRAQEPAESASDDTVPLTDVSVTCPICTTDQPCRILQVCSHNVCLDCWKQWRQTSTSNIPIAEPVIEADTLQRERDANFQKLRSLLPHTEWGGTATRPNTRTRSNLLSIEAARERFLDRLLSILNSLDHHGNNHARDEERSLEEFWTAMRQMAIHLLCSFCYITTIIGKLYSMAAVEITIRVIQERADDIVANLHAWGVIPKEQVEGVKEAPMPKQQATAYVEFLQAVCCERMAELYEAERKTHAAIHWYKRALDHGKKWKELYELPEKLEEYEIQQSYIRQLYSCLGRAQERACLLSESMVNYEAACEYCIDEEGVSVSEERKSFLQFQIRQWTGTSGKLTPGL